VLPLIEPSSDDQWKADLLHGNMKGRVTVGSTDVIKPAD
jgi:hypothetical protein